MSGQAAPVVESDELTLHALDFEPDPECDYTRVVCHQVVTWRVECTLCHGWGLVCTEHMRALRIRDEYNDERFGGQRCAACKGVSTGLNSYTPIISADLGTLW